MSDKIIKEKIEITHRKAELALKELLTEGARISQHSVEKRAGLSNGALNYNVDIYKDLKARIKAAKQLTSSDITSSKKNLDKNSLQKEIRLKNKYREERDKLKEQITDLIGKNVELSHNLMLLQRYIKHLEEKGLAHSNIVKFKPSKKFTDTSEVN